MAIIYRAQIRPAKLELIGSWLPTQPWFGARRVDGLASLGAYRFDDPAGDVGIETLLIDVAGEAVQVPMTYGVARRWPVPSRACWGRWSIRCWGSVGSTTRAPIRST